MVNHSLGSLLGTRSPTRLRSASTSTFGTTLSGSSASPSNVSASTQYTHSVSPAPSIASRLFSPWRRRVFGAGNGYYASSTRFADDASLRSVTLDITGAPNAPRDRCSEPSSMDAPPIPIVGENGANSNASRSIVSTSESSSASFGCGPPTNGGSCSPPLNHRPALVRPPNGPARPRGIVLSRGERLAIYDRDRHSTSAFPRSFTQSNVDVSVSASDIDGP